MLLGDMGGVSSISTELININRNQPSSDVCISDRNKREAMLALETWDVGKCQSSYQ